MGDLRNKIKHIEDVARQHADLAAQRQRDMDRQDDRPRCQCGHTYTDGVRIWAGEAKDRWSPVPFYCPDCLPEEYRWLLEREQQAPAPVESNMAQKTPSVLIRVRHEGPGRYVARREGRPKDSPLGTGANMNIAIGGARREAAIIAKTEGSRAVIEVEQPNGTFKREDAYDPPAPR